MLRFIKGVTKSILTQNGYTVVHNSILNSWVLQKSSEFSSSIGSDKESERWIDLVNDKSFFRIYSQCKNMTMTSIERMFALYQAANYVIKTEVEGAFVECGVWRGGSMMLCAFVLNKVNVKDREIYLYDTFRGMPKPTKQDISFSGAPAMHEWSEKQNGIYSDWCVATLSEVRENMQNTGYPINRIRFVKGMVEETIPSDIPDKIALLRLDTDFYKSTKHELKYLYPRIPKGGILILDDYGHWKGQQQAVDEYIADNNLNLLLIRVDHACRIAIKT